MSIRTIDSDIIIGGTDKDDMNNDIDIGGSGKDAFGVIRAKMSMTRPIAITAIKMMITIRTMMVIVETVTVSIRMMTSVRLPACMYVCASLSVC